MTTDEPRNLDDILSSEALEEGRLAEIFDDLIGQVRRLRDSRAVQCAAAEQATGSLTPEADAPYRILNAVTREMKQDEAALRDIEAALDLLRAEIKAVPLPPHSLAPTTSSKP